MSRRAPNTRGFVTEREQNFRHSPLEIEQEHGAPTIHQWTPGRFNGTRAGTNGSVFALSAVQHDICVVRAHVAGHELSQRG
jgi:hypothetical protein